MRRILSKMRKLIEEQELIKNGDKIAVGVSGGKDSLLLLKALHEYKKYFNSNFELIAIAIDLSNREMDYNPIKKYCEELNIEFYVENSNIFEIIFDIRKEKNPCSLCAKMRRGYLNNVAKKHGCNKVALGHHADDLIDTFLMSMFFEGRLYVLQPKTYLSQTDITIIRPLLFVQESEIKNESKNLPVIENKCPQNHNSQRENAKNILNKLSEIYPESKNKIINALIHSERYHLWPEK